MTKKNHKAVKNHANSEGKSALRGAGTEGPPKAAPATAAPAAPPRPQATKGSLKLLLFDSGL